MSRQCYKLEDQLKDHCHACCIKLNHISSQCYSIEVVVKLSTTNVKNTVVDMLVGSGCIEVLG